MSSLPNPAFHRLGLLVGADAIEALEKTSVIVFGLGGVGSWTAEALVRSGIGRITIVDNDSVCVTNINRQLQALSDTVGQPKAAALMKRLLSVNPNCRVQAFNQVFSKETAPLFGFEKQNYIIDAIDSLGHKLDLIELAHKSRNPHTNQPVFFSSMGMACKLDPVLLRTADIWDTSRCPLARLVRQGLRKRGFTGHFTVVYSEEHSEKNAETETVCGTDACFCSNKDTEWCSSKKVINGSAVPVTASAGMILASLVIKDVLAGCGGG